MQTLRKISILSIWLILGGMSCAQEIRAVKVTDLEKIIRETDKPLVINFWATWCRPCLEEIPWFEKLVAERKDSIRLILVSLDFKEEFPEGIRKIVLKRNFHAEVVWLNETNADYFCPRIDKDWSGSLPASLFVDPKGKKRFFREEQVPEKELKDLLDRLLVQ